MQKDTLAFNQRVVAQDAFTFKLFKASRTMFVILAPMIGHKHTKQTDKETKNNAPIKSKL
jgi:hypothetical protein